MIEENDNPYEEKFFDKMANLPPRQPSKKLYRSKNNVVLAGVCAGIADYLKIDVANIRLFALLSLLIGGWGMAAYIITAFLLPAENNSDELPEAEKSALQKENFRTLSGGLLMLAGLYFAFNYTGISYSGRIFILPDGIVFPVAAILIGLFILSRKHNFNSGSPEVRAGQFFRSRRDKIFTGVCGGLAEYLNTDASLLRIIFIISGMLTLGFFAVAYLLLTLFTNSESVQNFE